MAGLSHADRLVGLFLQHALPEGADHVTGLLTPEAIERGIEATLKMLGTEDAVRMGAAPASTFVCLAMALEEKPQLQWGAVRCYEKALDLLGKRSANWERAVILQQIGAVCSRSGSHGDAVKWLAECAEECRNATGHPRDAKIFEGNFSTQQTRLEFTAMVEKLRAQAYHKLGDMPKAHAHLAEAQRLEAAAKGGDAVERTVPASASTAPSVAPAPGDLIKELWAADAGSETRLKRYRYEDEGPTVLLTLDLNDHLDLGPEASTVVDSLKQFRVNCSNDSVDIRLRLKDSRSRVREYRLWLQPLAHEIIPEDTVPRLKGREGKRRLEVKLFKRDKDRKWFGDLVTGVPKDSAKESEEDAKNGAKAAPKGTQLNPLTPEELARLPRPNGTGCDNRPSEWRINGTGGPPVPQQKVATNLVAPAAAPLVAEVGLEEMD